MYRLLCEKCDELKYKTAKKRGGGNVIKIRINPFDKFWVPLAETTLTTALFAELVEAWFSISLNVMAFGVTPFVAIVAHNLLCIS